MSINVLFHYFIHNANICLDITTALEHILAFPGHLKYHCRITSTPTALVSLEQISNEMRLNLLYSASRLKEILRLYILKIVTQKVHVKI